jgi:hypothetical protein
MSGRARSQRTLCNCFIRVALLAPGRLMHGGSRPPFPLGPGDPYGGCPSPYAPGTARPPFPWPPFTEGYPPLHISLVHPARLDDYP